MGTFCPNPKSICKKFAKDLQKNRSKFAKILQKVVATKSAKSLHKFCKYFATTHFAKRFAL